MAIELGKIGALKEASFNGKKVTEAWLNGKKIWPTMPTYSYAFYFNYNRYALNPQNIMDYWELSTFQVDYWDDTFEVVVENTSMAQVLNKSFALMNKPPIKHIAAIMNRTFTGGSRSCLFGCLTVGSIFPDNDVILGMYNRSIDEGIAICNIEVKGDSPEDAWGANEAILIHMNVVDFYSNTDNQRWYQMMSMADIDPYFQEGGN